MESLIRMEMCLQDRPRPRCVAELAPVRPHQSLPRVENAGKERMDSRPGRRQGLEAGTVGEWKGEGSGLWRRVGAIPNVP